MLCETNHQSATIENKITSAGGTTQDINVWREAWKNIEQFCDIEHGTKTDDYTKDIVLCWVGWVMETETAITDRIYSSIDGFNLTIKDNDDGHNAEKIINTSIDKHVSDPMEVYSAIAEDQLQRYR